MSKHIIGEAAQAAVEYAAELLAERQHAEAAPDALMAMRHHVADWVVQAMAEAIEERETAAAGEDVRERVARECVEEAERLQRWHGEGYAKAQRLLREAAALLRTPRGEGEAEPLAWRVEFRPHGEVEWQRLGT